MKVFSKGYKNKSTPALNTFSNIEQSTIISKPKHMNKLKTFKQILTQNVQITALKKDDCTKSKHNQNNSRPKTQRNYNIFNQSSDLRFNTDISSPHDVTAPSVKMINSVISKNYRQTNDSTQQKIDSILYYGKQRQVSNFINNSICLTNENKQFNNTCENTNKLNVSTKSQHYAKEKVNQIQAYKINKENQFKRINYYKNSKIVNYNKTVLKKQWTISNFKIGKKIGRGRFGSVYVVQQRESGAIFALKKIDLVQVKEQQMEGQIIEQIKLQVFMNYPNIVKLYGFFREENYLCLILEYAEGKCLFSKLNKKIQEREVSYYTLQMIKALRYCHSQSILHRDLKPENILLCFGVAKLADFGWAAYAPKYKRSTFCGTLDYVPPEIIKGNYYDQKVDIWSLGVLIYQMSIGYAPFETHPNDPSLTQQMTMKRILDCDLKIPMSITAELKHLIESILSTQPQNRPSLQDIENSSWMQRYKQQGMQIHKNIWDYWTKLVDR